MTGAAATGALMLAAPLLDTRVALAATDPAGPHQAYPEELAALSRATTKRQREFAAGRAAARLSLRELGAPALAIPMGTDRAPVWPPGLLGSITHTDTACLAATAWEGEIRLLGLDMEPDTPLDTDLMETICIPAERDWLARQDMAGHWAKLIFSAKECAYKAQYRLSRALIGFDAIAIRPDPVSQSFAATFQTDIPPFSRGETLHGRFARGGGLIITVLAVAA
ncbi:4'-phosphopantetheinyl transferase superfamily protein [Ruegeria pomeroyi]|uniref:4'-phosphopantetheinyl transferase family protein n=1 Tax=Ruegeria pomeroyi TaxID=89184 RepID=UPI001F892A38|nr:4'-phosphopantetheinyl transferase superfamily protein [Ruegeria pomeroyi]MCE8512882.1 4'-phosphopantetheinyl transferase superfamily protein [Ruegeria pomeroyi]MCE8526386.1 4'-phosphopantetheinyl transferase superfamily protein [Ruegeria pomeroyi]MCE8529654.1 4'-phosphopantetheinyl transferase superfamily protein [Ruegeria pomeroyi]